MSLTSLKNKKTQKKYGLYRLFKKQNKNNRSVKGGAPPPLRDFCLSMWRRTNTNRKTRAGCLSEDTRIPVYHVLYMLFVILALSFLTYKRSIEFFLSFVLYK